MAKDGASVFYEILRQQKESEAKKVPGEGAPKPVNVAPQDTAPSAPHPAMQEMPEGIGEPQAVPPPAAATVSASPAQVLPSTRESVAKTIGLATSTPRMVTFRLSKVVVCLIGVVLALMFSFIVGQVRGKKAHETDPAAAPGQENPPVLRTTMHNPDFRTDSGTGSQNAAAGADGRSISAGFQTKAVWILVLRRYPLADVASAQKAHEKLRQNGFPTVTLAKDKESIYLYVGRFRTRDDPELIKYQAHFAAREEFKSCYPKPIVAQ